MLKLLLVFLLIYLLRLRKQPHELPPSRLDVLLDVLYLPKFVLVVVELIVDVLNLLSLVVQLLMYS